MGSISPLNFQCPLHSSNEQFGKAESQTQGRWVRSKNATQCALQPPRFWKVQSKSLNAGIGRRQWCWQFFDELCSQSVPHQKSRNSEQVGGQFQIYSDFLIGVGVGVGFGVGVGVDVGAGVGRCKTDSKTKVFRSRDFFPLEKLIIRPVFVNFYFVRN